MEQTPQCVNNNAQKPLDQALSDYSPKDSKWDTQRATVQDMSRFLFEAQRFERWAERMDGCTRTLGFGEVVDTTTGEISPKLIQTFSAIAGIASCAMVERLWCV